MSEVTYEGGTAYFVVYADEMIISNFTALNIGTFQLKEESQYSKYSPWLFTNVSSADFPLFDCYFFGGSNSQDQNNLTATQIYVTSVLKFGGGLPVFQAKQLSSGVSGLNVVSISES